MTMERADRNDAFLLDTNIISEWAKPRPDPGVIQWLHEVEEDRVHLSVLSLGEIRRGIDLLDPGKRRRDLESWLNAELMPRFADRLLSIDGTVAETWGRLSAQNQKAGRPAPVVDGLIGATALVQGLVLVTRNVRDFQHLGVRLLDPARLSDMPER